MNAQTLNLHLQRLFGAHSALLQGMAAPALIIMVLAMMVLPLPTLLPDLLFTFTIASALLVLAAAS